MGKSKERKYIHSCKKEIEKVLALDNSNFSLKSSDLEYLSRLIQEKSGINISLSTLKRLWKGDFSQLPQPTTLDALATVLDYKNWQEFKQANQIKTKRTSLKIILSFGIILIVIVSLISLIYVKLEKNNKPKKPKINGPVHFSAEKTVTSGIPNTVIFKYDVSNVEADSFFIQQSWNDRHKERIDRRNNVLSSIYYIPGFHNAKLIANNKVIATQNVHILSNGWMPYINYDVCDLLPKYLNRDSNVSEGRFKINKKNLEKAGIDINKDFILRLNNSFDFGVTDNNFSIKTKFKCDSIKPISCPHMDILLQFGVQIFWISLIKKGCEYNVSYKIGEKYADGKNNDLSSLGCNVYEWQELELSVHNKQAVVLLNGKPVLHTKYSKDFGRLVDIIYTFDGLGSVDYVKLFGAEGQIVFEDNFEKQ